MSAKYARTAAVSFVIGYLLAYYLVLWLGNTIFSDTVANSMAILGRHETKLKIVLLGSPVVAVWFGSLTAGISITSYSAMGSHRLSPARFFVTGWVWFCTANALIVSTGLQLFIDNAVGREWIRQIGAVGFNTWFFFLAPTLGYLNGIFTSILVRKLVEAQNS